MTQLPFIAELHDIGKLVDWDGPGLSGKVSPGSPRHMFHNFDLSQLNISPPISPSWWGQWSDSIKDIHATGRLPSGITDEGKACVLLTNVADVLAASISRTWGEKGSVQEGLRLLWDPSVYDRARQKGGRWAAFGNPDDLREMFQFIDSCKEPQEFLDKYNETLLLTPEDKSAPLNFIPLRTHLELTGKVFRVLRYHSRLVQIKGKTRIEYDGQAISQFQEAAGGRWNEAQKGKWIFRLISCKVFFPQSMVRLQDLNVLELRKLKMREIVMRQLVGGDPERQPYAVLFQTDDFLCLFLPREEHLSLRDVLRPLWERGFWIECEELEAELNLLTSTGERTRRQLQQTSPGGIRLSRYLKLRRIAVWPDLDPLVFPPLCELCQHDRGQVYVKDQIREYLCPSCREVREMGTPASMYARWEEEGLPAAWLKISLDQELLLRSLQRLFALYVEAGPGMEKVSTQERETLKEGFRPLAAQMEFVREYEELLRDFQERIGSLKGGDGTPLLKPGESLLFPISGYRELAIVRLDTAEILRGVIEIFIELLRRRFPECLTDCPIRLSVSMGNPKYPYDEHWRYFSEPHEPGVALCIQHPGVRQLAITVDQYMALRDKLVAEKLGHFLHRLAGIESEMGEMTALLQVLEQRQRFPQMHKVMVLYRLRLRQILDYYRLVGLNPRHREVPNG